MIPWPGDEMHDPDRDGGCWGDQGGTDCTRPAGRDGLCDACRLRITGRS